MDLIYFAELSAMDNSGLMTAFCLAVAVIVLLGFALLTVKTHERRRRQDERAAVEALRASEARFRSWIENGSDLISIVDNDGRILFQSRSVLHVLGCTPESVVGTPFHELVHPDERNNVVARLAAREPWSAELRVRHADGGWRWLESTANSISHDGKEAVIISSRDLSERKRLEAQLIQSQKMEAVGRLAGGVAHDFNNVLTAIKGYADLILSETDRDPESVRADLMHIRNAANRASLMTRQLLAFSRRQLLAPRIMDVNVTAREIESLLHRLIGEDIELVFDLDEQVGPLRADPTQLQQVLMNLAVNARDAMPEGGRLTVRTANVDVDAAGVDGIVPAGQYVCISVSDSGSGMSAEVMSHIFEPFYTTKEAGRGTGLGLSTVYGVVKQSGGYILVSSVDGHGSTFNIYLPRLAADQMPSDAAAIPPHTGLAPEGVLNGDGLSPNGPSVPRNHGTRGETILVVEDEADVREVVRRLLEQVGYTVLVADGGHVALDIGANHKGPIHLLLTDVVMPQMSGPQVADSLVSTRRDLRVLYMSGYTANALAERRLSTTGALLPKPFTPAMLTERVRQTLDSNT